jgi:hypothetical protein
LKKEKFFASRIAAGVDGSPQTASNDQEDCRPAAAGGGEKEN